MKIVQMITTLGTVGGAQEHVMAITRKLLADGHEVYVLYGGRSIYSFSHERLQWITLKHLVHPVRPVKDVQAVREVQGILKEIAPDVIATHSSKAGIIGRIAANLLGIPCVFTAHGWAFTEGKKGLQAKAFLHIEKLMARFTDEIIAVSGYDAALAKKHGLRCRGSVQVIRNGIAPMQYVKKPAQQPTIVMVARFEQPKRFDLLAEAFEKLGHREARLVLVGDGGQRSRVEQQVADYQTVSRIEFVGAQQTIMPYLAEAHIFVLLSDYEGLPLAIIEAMNAELPIIASNVGGVCELVADGVNGYLVENSSEAICERLSELIEKPDLRERMGRESAARFQKHFQLEHMYERTSKVYERATKRVQKGLLRGNAQRSN